MEPNANAGVSANAGTRASANTSANVSVTADANVGSRNLQIPAKLYRIGELVSYTPFSRQTIHNYTIMGLIRETQWTAGGHRLYDESVFERLSKILELKKTKTLSQIKHILAEDN